MKKIVGYIMILSPFIIAASAVILQKANELGWGEVGINVGIVAGLLALVSGGIYLVYYSR
jgi:histidine ammonia-lyase